MKGQGIGSCKGEKMKQILITRHQLDQIIAVENGKLAGKVAREQNDFTIGLKLTSYVCDLSDHVLNRLFGDMTDEDLRIEEAKAKEALSRMKELEKGWEDE